MAEAAREKEVAQEVAQERGEECVCQNQAALPIRRRQDLSIVMSLMGRPPERCSASMSAVVVEGAKKEGRLGRRHGHMY